MFIGDGISPPHWWAQGQRRGHGTRVAAWSRWLPSRKRSTSSTACSTRKGDGGHARCTGNILSGAALQRGRTIRGGVSMDQRLAKHFEEETALPSLVLGCEQPVSGFHESQYSMVYASHISWRNPDSPVPIELYPSLGLRQPVRQQGRQAARQHPRRGAANRPTTCSGKVSGSDQAKLDEYLVVRARDRTARAAAQSPGSKEKRRPIVPPGSDRRPGSPRTSANTAGSCADIIALAFQTDRSRIATLLLSRDLSGQVYPFLGIRDDHHSYSHPNDGPGVPVDREVPRRAVRLPLDKLAKMQEGERTRARQLVHHVRVGALERAQRHAGAAGARGRPRRHAADRPHARLPEGRQRQAASCAACTSRSWTAWAWSCPNSATPRNGWRGSMWGQFSTCPGCRFHQAIHPPRTTPALSWAGFV